MRPHPYLRAYMAGIVVPTVSLLGIMMVFAYEQYYFEVPDQFVVPLPGRPLERAFLFPMAVVPNVWGMWNVLHVALRSRVRLPLGVHGALLPLILMPGGVAWRACSTYSRFNGGSLFRWCPSAWRSTIWRGSISLDS